jgi:putative transcriptional regulator
MFAPSDIRSLRGRLGLTQSQFAELLGVDQSTISTWERGVNIPRGPARKVLESLVPADEPSGAAA